MAYRYSSLPFRFSFDPEKTGEKDKDSKWSRTYHLLFLIANVLLFCFAVVAIAIGAWVRSDEMTPYLSPHFSDEQWQIGDSYTMTATVIQLKAFSMIIEGCIIIALIVMAFIGMRTDDRAAAGAYSIGFLVTIGLAILIFVKGIPSQWQTCTLDEIKSEMEARYDGLYIDSDYHFTQAFDDVQIKDHCCGLNGYTDYTTFNLTTWVDRGHLVPLACCIPSNEPIEVFWNGTFKDADLCMNQTVPEYTWTNGCINILWSRARLYFAIMAFVSCSGVLIQIFTITVVLRMVCF